MAAYIKPNPLQQEFMYLVLWADNHCIGLFRDKEIAEQVADRAWFAQFGKEYNDGVRADEMIGVRELKVDSLKHAMRCMRDTIIM